MPEISRFFGIIIAMFHADHAPPHFHVRYGEHKALIAIETLTVLRGSLSPRVLGMVVERGFLHREELLENWRLGRREAALKKIPPLEQAHVARHYRGAAPGGLPAPGAF